MTVSAPTTPGRSSGSNNLHGTLRLLSKKHCRKSSERLNRNKIERRPRAQARANLPRIRKASTRRNGRLKVALIDNDDEDDTSNSNGDIEDKGVISTENHEKNEILSPEIGVKAEKSTAVALPANDSASTECYENRKEAGVRRKADKKKKTCVATKTKMAIKLMHPEDLAQYEQAEKLEKRAMKKIETARWKVYNDQVQQIWGVYMFGLKHVLALNDLSDAPDAILPGNF